MVGHGIVADGSLGRVSSFIDLPIGWLGRVNFLARFGIPHFIFVVEPSLQIDAVGIVLGMRYAFNVF